MIEKLQAEVERLRQRCLDLELRQFHPNNEALDLFQAVARGELTPFAAEEARMARDTRYRAMLDVASQYYTLLQTGKDDPELKTRLDILVAPFSKDAAFVAFLTMERLAALKSGT